MNKHERSFEMELIEGIKGRRSIRNYKEDKISREVLEDIVTTASFAPSWKNTQVTRYLIVDDKAVINEIAEKFTTCFSYNGGTIAKAAALVAVTALKGRSGVEKDGSFTTGREASWLMFDAGCAVQTFCLAAHEKGLGTVIMGIFDEGISDYLKIPEDREIVNLICVGYPAEEPQAPKRKTAADLITYFGE